MDLSITQHNQEIGNETLESILICTKQPQQEKSKLPRPHAAQALKCPRCESTNTKFCYYNNYSLTQPRYFCKSCRRYWTQGGTLRNVPVGGSYRKSSKRSSSSSSSSKTSKNTGQLELHPPFHPNHLIPSLTYDSHQDHELALAAFSNLPMRFDEHDHHQVNVGNYHLESAMDLQNLYYGDDQLMGIGGGGGMIMGGLNMVDQEIVGIPLSGMGENRTHNRVLWGFPWKFAGENHGDHNNNNMNMVGDYDQKGMITTTTWNGVLNSPLM